MITILDYGLGNVLAFVNVYKRLNLPAKVASKPEDLAGATKLILPGVGAFDYAMTLFNRSGLREPAEKLVLQDKMPVIGICVGMQMLASGSDEGGLPGLGWVPGRVRRIDASALTHQTRLPHMGWNDVEPTQVSPLFKQLERDARFYFLHSYYFDTPSSVHQLATAHYGSSFTCAVNNGNVYGVQFHPEKSHQDGSRLLQNFAEL
jgi:glutamine amidotransferase